MHAKFLFYWRHRNGASTPLLAGAPFGGFCLESHALAAENWFVVKYDAFGTRRNAIASFDGGPSAQGNKLGQRNCRK